MHEYGHYMQSQDLGYSYLFVIGIPSLNSALTSSTDYEHRQHWAEKWADDNALKKFGDKFRPEWEDYHGDRNDNPYYWKNRNFDDSFKMPIVKKDFYFEHLKRIFSSKNDKKVRDKNKDKY